MPFCQSCGEIVKGSSDKCSSCGGKAKDSLTSGFTTAENRGDTISNAYLSSGLRAGVDAGLRRAMGLEEKPVNEICSDCSLALTKESDLFVGPTHAGGLVYCEGCYSKHFKKGDCGTCGKPVLGLGREYVMEGTRVWHKECYKGASCHGCSKAIMGQAIGALGKQYHPDCFVCFNCRKVMGNEPIVEWSGEVCCKKCCEDIRSARSGSPEGSAVNVTTASVGGVKNAAATGGSRTDLPKTNATASSGGNATYGDMAGDLLPKCDKCHEPVHGGDGVQLPSGAILHTHCFCCGTCGKPITGGGKFVQDGTTVHHPECRILLVSGAGKTPTCSKCKKAISGGFVKTDDGKMMHSDCFVCAGCGTTLAGQAYVDASDGPRCEACMPTSKQVSVQRGLGPAAGAGTAYGVRKDLRGAARETQAKTNA